MAAERVLVRDISWRDVFPWLIIFRTFRLAISIPVLFLATIGALLTPVGWRIGEWLFVSEPIDQWPGQHGLVPVPDAGQFPTSFEQVLSHTLPPFQDTVEPIFHRFAYPFAQLFDRDLSAGGAAYFVFGGLWMLFAWSFFGGSITRIAAVKLGREERIGLGEATSFAGRRLLPYVGAPIFPMIGIVFAAIPIYLLGLLMRMDWGVLVAGVLWIFVLLGGLVITILFMGLLFGWPLMWATISSERAGDAFEALQRSYSYTFQRPMHFLFYALLGIVFGGFCWLLVYHVSESVIAFSYWPATWGAGVDRWAEIQTAMDGAATGAGLMGYGAFLLGLCANLIRSIANGFGYGFFWCLAVAIYLLLRRDTDQTEFDEIFVENEDRTHQLPELMASDTLPDGAENDQATSDQMTGGNPHGSSGGKSDHGLLRS